jgi:calcium-dependent protein kinase
MAMTAMAVQSSPSDIKHLKEIFMAIDVNGDGSLTFEEIEVGFKQLKLGNAADLLQAMKAADTDGSGTVDYTEFIAATLDAQFTNNERNLKAAFDMFDTDGSGKIDNNEVLMLL